MVTPVTKNVGFLPGNDYGSLYDLEALNLNLVGLDQSYTVNMNGGINPSTTMTGWTTDATRFLKFIGPVRPDGRIINPSNLLDRVHVTDTAGTQALAISGAMGYVEFQNMSFNTRGNASNVSITAAGQYRFVNCVFYQGYNIGGTISALFVNNAGATIECINCIFVVNNTGAGSKAVYTQACSATSKFYHCHFIGAGANGIDLGNQTVLLKNCYAKGTTAAYANAGSATLTKCASSDATGSEVGLHNIVWTYANWASAAAGFYQDPEPITGNCINGGADVSGDAAPFNVSTDIFGRAYVTASPSIGCRQYAAANPRVRHLYVGNDTGAVSGSHGLATSDFATLAAASAANHDLVTNQEMWFLECTPGGSDTAAITFNGWNTNSTYRVHVRNAEYSVTRRWVDDLPKNSISSAFYNAIKGTAGDLLTVGDIGASGLLVFEGLQLEMNHSSVSHMFTNSAAGTGGNVQFRRCKLMNLLGTGKVINGPAGGGNSVYITNCTVVHGAGSSVTAVDWNANVLKAHHCTVFVSNAALAVKTGFNMHDTAGCAVKNCMVHLVNPNVGSNCYVNMANVDFVKCGSSDATGTDAAIQSLAYNLTNWIDASTSYFLFPKSTGPLARSGTDLSALADPLNCTHDYAGTVRSAANPSIGAFECSATISDYNGSWTAKQTGINLVKAQGVSGIIQFSVDNKLYIYTRHKAGQSAEIYSSSDNGDNWSLEYSTGALQQHIVGAAEFGGKLYFVVEDLSKIITYDPSGPTWSISADYLNGAANTPTFATGLFVAQGKIWCVISGAPSKADLYNSPDGVTWTAVTLPASINASANSQGLSACTTPAGDVILFTSLGSTLAWLPNGGTVWGTLCLGNFMNPSSSGMTMAYDAQSKVIYLVGLPGNEGIGLSSLVRIPVKLDIQSQTVEAGYTMSWIAQSPNAHWWNGFVRFDLWWGSYQATTSSGYLFSINASDIPGKWNGYVTSMNEGANLSGPSKNMVQNCNTILANGYAFFGVRDGTVQYAAVMRSPLLTNSHKMDNASLRNGLWNNQKYAFSSMAKASSGDHPYSRLGMSPGSGTDASNETRRVDNYFSSPLSYTWRQLRGAVNGAANWLQFKEDLARFHQKVFKDGQPFKMHAPCLISGARVPIAFVDPGAPKASETLTYSGVTRMNNFALKFRWSPIHDPQALDADVDFATIGSGVDYVRLIERSVSYDTRPNEREFFPANRYGRHDPIWTIRKVVGGITVVSHDIAMYPAYPGENEAGDIFGDDVWEFEVVNVKNTVFGIRIVSAGLAGEWWSPAAGLLDYPSNPVGNVTFTGYGYFGAPTALNQLDEEFTHRTGPARKLPSMRTDVVRRLQSGPQNPVFAGDRDPTEGVLTPDNPFLSPDIFNRPDAGSLGGKWSTVLRTGAGWYISGAAAKCSGTGIEKWTPSPRHSGYEVYAKVTITDDNNVVDVVARHESIETALMGYSAELVQTGPAAATLNICRWWKGSKTVLTSAALSAYTAGTEYMLLLLLDGTNLTGTVTDLPGGVVLATASTTDVFITKPGVAGLYGTTGGPAEVISVSEFGVVKNFNSSVT